MVNHHNIRESLEAVVLTLCLSCVSSDSIQVEEDADAGVADQLLMIPCEFCLEIFDEHTIADHEVSGQLCLFSS